MEHAVKNNNLIKSEVLANCFLNMYTIKSVYGEELTKEIYKNCPEMFKNGIRVPDFYLNIIKLKIDKLT